MTKTNTSGAFLASIDILISNDKKYPYNSAFVRVTDSNGIKEFAGIATDEQIQVRRRLEPINNKEHQIELLIHRYTGKFTESILLDELPGLVFYGNCKKSTGKKF